MKIAVKEVGKELQIVETFDKYRSDCTKFFTGEKQRAEFVKLNADGTFCLGVNEEGLMRELPVNFLIETTNAYFPIQKMVGTAVFVRTKYADPWVQEIYDFEVDDLTQEDLILINHILDKKYQKQLEDQFEDYGKGYFVIDDLGKKI